MTREQILILVLYAAATGILNLVLAERSRIDAWAEANPRLAAVLKLFRSLGVDPWMLVAAVKLAITKRLPEEQRAGSLSLEPPPSETRKADR